MDWLRLWHDMPTDPKWRVIARRSGKNISTVIAVYNFILVCASKSEERGTLTNWSDEDVAAALDVDEADILAIREAMQGKVLDGDCLTGWQRRQPNREDYSTPRVQKHRAKNETQCNANETACNAPDKNREEQIITDTEQKQTQPQLDPTPEAELFSKACAIFSEHLSLTNERKKVLFEIRTNPQFGAAKFMTACRNLAASDWPTKSITYFTDKKFDAQNRVDLWANGGPPRNGPTEPEPKRNWVGGKPI